MAALAGTGGGQGTALTAKTVYKARKLEVFFTGGPARLTRDGKLLACACGEEVKVVDVETGAVLHTLPGDSEPVTALAVSPDCKTVVVGSRSCGVRTFDLTTGAQLRSWRAHKAPVSDMVVDASGGYVATAGADRVVKVWDLQAGFCTHSFTGHSGVVLRLLFHPKQLLLVSGGDDGEVRVWDLVDKACVAHLKAHFSSVTSLALSPDGWLLLTGGRDKVVVAWDLRGYKKVTTVPVYEAVEGVVCLPLGAPFPGCEDNIIPAVTSQGGKKAAFFATCGERGVIKLWRSDTGACVYDHSQGGPPSSAPSPSASSTTSPVMREYTDMSLLPGGQGLVVTTGDSRLLLLKADPGRKSLTLSRQLVGNLDEVTDVRWVGGPREDPSHLAVATNCEVIHLVDKATLSVTASCEGHRDTVLAMDAVQGALPGGGTLLASGGKDNEVRVWEAPSGRCLGLGVGHVGSVGAVALGGGRRGRQGPLKFVASAGADKLLKVWDLTALLESLAEAEQHQEAQQQQQQSPKKKRKGSEDQQAAVSKGGLHQLRATAAVAAHDKDINSVAVAPNDTLIATGSQDRTAKVWKLPGLTPVATLRGHKRGVWSVEFSPVDQALLTASGDRTIRLWSLADGGSCVRTFEGHLGSVLRSTFLTLGTQVLSCGADGLVKLWSVRSGECTATFDEHEGKIWALAAGGENESLVATGGSDACVALWHDATASEAAAAEAAEEELVEKEQDLANALAAHDYVSAARLAFDLKHPGRLLTVIQRAAAAASKAPGLPLAPGPSAQQQQQAQTVLEELVRHMADSDMRTALEYCREWNTNTRHCHAAQAMLRALLRTRRPAQLAAIPGARELCDALLAYSQRHYARVDRLLRSTHLLGYTLSALKVLQPAGVEGEEQVTQAAAATGRQPSSFFSSLDHPALTRGAQALQDALDHAEVKKTQTQQQQQGARAGQQKQPQANGIVNGHAPSQGSDTMSSDEGEEDDEQLGGGRGGHEASPGVKGMFDQLDAEMDDLLGEEEEEDIKADDVDEADGLDDEDEDEELDGDALGEVDGSGYGGLAARRGGSQSNGLLGADGFLASSSGSEGEEEEEGGEEGEEQQQGRGAMARAVKQLQHQQQRFSHSQLGRVVSGLKKPTSQQQQQHHLPGGKRAGTPAAVTQPKKQGKGSQPHNQAGNKAGQQQQQQQQGKASPAGKPKASIKASAPNGKPQAPGKRGRS